MPPSAAIHCYADDIAVSDAGGQGCSERFVGADLPDALIGLLLHVQNNFPESGSETGKLNAAQTDGEVEPNTEKYDQHNRPEQKRTQFSEDLSNDCFHFLFSFAKKFRGTLLSSSPVLRLRLYRLAQTVTHESVNSEKRAQRHMHMSADMHSSQAQIFPKTVFMIPPI